MAKRYNDSKKMMKKMGSMISDKSGAMANLPTEVMMKQYEGHAEGMEGYMDDLYKGVQRQMKEDASDFKRLTRPGKY